MDTNTKSLNEILHTFTMQAVQDGGLSKGKCEEALLSVIDQIDLATLDEFYLQKLGYVLAFFRPKPTAKARMTKAADNFHHWLEMAAAKSDVRYYLNHVYSAENGDMVATDGHRMHVVEGVGLPVGFYNREDSTHHMHGNDYGRFPDYTRLIPRNKDDMRPVTLNFVLKGSDKLGNYCLLLDDAGNEVAFEVNKGNKTVEGSYNAAYIEQMAAGFTEYEAYMDSIGRLAVWGTNAQGKKCFALTMPRS